MRPADDGKRLPGDGRFISPRKLSSEVECRGGDGSQVLTRPEAGGLLQNAIYIYIYIRKLNFLRSRFGEVFGEVLERFLERFWRGLGRGFREVLAKVLKRFCIPKSY